MMYHFYKSSFPYSPSNFQKICNSDKYDRYKKEKFIRKAKRYIIAREKGINVKTFNIDCSNNNIITAHRFEKQKQETNEETPMIICFFGNICSELNENHFTNFCSHLCEITNSVVLNINTSPANEAKFPSASQETLDAIKWAWQACLFWKINRGKIYIFAECYGANSALKALMDIRDSNCDIKIAGIILSDPLVNCTLSSKSFSQFSHTPTISTADIEYYISQYISDRTQIFDQDISLILKKDWTRLSTMLLLASRYSPLWDDSVFLYHKMLESGKNIIFYPLKNTYNGFLYSRTYPEKHKVEKMITTFITNNDPEYIKLVFS